jgi:hypothetical protein
MRCATCWWCRGGLSTVLLIGAGLLVRNFVQLSVGGAIG